MPTINGTNGQNFLFDTAGNDTLNGLGGNDSVYVRSGQDTANGGADTDTLYVDYSASDADFQINGENSIGEAGGAGPDGLTFSNFETFDIETGSGDDVVRTFFRPDGDGGAVISGNDTIRLNAGDDIAAGGAGDDRIYGGEGNDTIDGDGSLRGKFGGNLGDMTFTGNDLLFGGEGDDIIHGGAGIDLLDGGIGNDRLFGDGGIFAYTDATAFGGPSVSVAEQVGNDLTSGGDTINGGEGDDYIDGNAGDDLIIGGAGADTIFGGLGDDTAFVNASIDGADAVDLGLGDDVVNVSTDAPGQVRLTFTSAEVGNGAALDSNTMANQDGALAVRFQAEDGMGNLTGDISRYDDETITFVADDGVTFDVRDLVSGVARGDQFQVVTLGSSGADELGAMLGSRTYYINGGGGNDTITGGDVADFLVGGAGDDALNGGAGTDSFIGGGGNDVIDGGTGADRMDGGLGNDTFTVDDIGDVVVELADSGIDLVNSSISFDASANVGVDNITLTGTANTDATGNGLANALTGNTGANTLDGGAGADVLTGGRGDDIYIVDDAGDRIIEFNGQGLDTVNSSVSFSLSGQFADNLILTGNGAINGTGNSYNNVLTGNDAANILDGGKGDDRIVGGGGADVITGGLGADNLTGGAGNDIFVYTATNQSATGGGLDRINGLTNTDMIDLSAIDAQTNVTGNNAFTLVSAFSGTSGEMTISYNPNNKITSILMDTNGDSVADMKINLSGDHHDFTNFAF